MRTLMSEKIDSGKETYSFSFLLVLLLAAANLANVGIYVLALASVFLVLYRYKTVPICTGSVLLLLFVVSYATVYMAHYGISLYILKVLCLFLIWSMSFSASRGKGLNDIFRLVAVLAFGMAFHGILNFIYNLAIGTSMNVQESSDVFTHEVSAATGQAINFSLLVGYGFWGIFIQKKTWLKVLSLGAYLTALIYDIALGGRTFIILSAVALICGIIYMFATDRSPKRYRHAFMLLSAVALLALCIAILYRKNVFGIQSWVESSYLNRRIARHNALNVFSDGRVYKKSEYWKSLFAYLFGGNVVSRRNNVGYAHELWLDIFDDAGIIPFVLVIAYTVSALSTLCKILRERRIWYGYKVGLTCLYIVLYSQFFIEPILQVAPIFFASFLIVDAAVTRYSIDGPLACDSEAV